MHTSTNQTDAPVFAAAAGGEFVRRLAIGGASLSLLTGALYANPAGEQIVAGNVGITRNGNLTQITASNGAAINWNSFNIGTGHTVQFIQPGADARVLNRVTGPDPTSIAGTLLANGRVYIVNPAGVFFRAGAVVNAGAIYAAAGRISDADFARKLDRFSNLSGSVMNDGAIRAAQVVLTGAAVGNAGRIDSPQGTVIMASGSDVLIGERGGSMFARVAPGTAAAANAGSVAGVSNTGVVNARGGTYQAVTGDIFGMAIRQGGQVTASRIQVQGGNATTTTVDGTLDASGRGTGQRGGTIEVTGDRVALMGARLDASGTAGGGVVNVGGGYQGRGDLAHASQTIVDPTTTISVDAIDTGHGGQAVIWSDQYTLFRGNISARGSRADGNGGSVEVSSHDTLAFRGFVNASGQGRGRAGHLLLDPKNITVADTGPDALAGNTTFTDNAAGDVVFDADTLTAVLNGGTALELQANTDITINEAITVAAGGAGGTLTLRAGRSIIATANITTDNGQFFAFANDAGATTNRDAGAGVLTFTGTTVDTGTASATFSVGTNALAGALGGAINLGTVNAGSIIADSTGAGTPGSGAAGANTGAVIANGVLTVVNGGVTLRGGSVTTNAGGSIDTNASMGMGTVALTATAGDVTVGDTVATTGGMVTLSATNDVNVNAAIQTVGAAFVANADSDGTGAGAFVNTAGGTVNTTNAGADGSITITGADANVGGTLTAGTGNFIFAPSANTDIDLGDAASGAGFGLANGDLANLVGSGSVTIGDNGTTFVTNITIDNAMFANITAGMGNTLTLRAARSNNAGTISFDASTETFTQFANGLLVQGADAVSVSQTLTAPTIDLRAGTDGTGNLAINNGALLQGDTIALTAGDALNSTARVTFGNTASFRNQAGAAVPGNFSIISDAAIGAGGTDTNLPAATAFNAGGDLTGMAYALTSLNGITLTDASQTNNANLTLNNTTSGTVLFNAAGAFTFTGLALSNNILEIGQNTVINTPGAASAFGQIRTNADGTSYNLTVNITDAATLNFNHDIGGADVVGVPNVRALGDFSIQSATGGSVAFTGQGGAGGITQYINVGTLTIGTGGNFVNTTINATTLTQINAGSAATAGMTPAVAFNGTLRSANVAAQRDLRINLNANGANLIFSGDVGDTAANAATQRIGVLTVAGSGTGTTTNLPANLNIESGTIGNAVVLNQDSTVRAFGNNTVGIMFAGTVDSDNVMARTLTVNTQNGAFTTFTGNVGDNGGLGLASATMLAALSTDATGTATFARVFTTGAQTLQGSTVTLNGTLYNSTGGTITLGETGANNSVITLNSGGGATTTIASQGAGALGDIRLAGTVEASGQGTDALAVNTAGTTTFSAAMGGVTPLLAVTTDAAGSVSTASITVNDPTGNVGGNITFNELTITLNGAYTTNGGNFAAEPNVSFGGIINIAGNTSVNTNNTNTNLGGFITFGQTVEDAGGVGSPFSLSTTSNLVSSPFGGGGNPAGEGTIFASVGTVTPLLSLTTNGTGNVGLFGNVTTTAGQNYANTGGTEFYGTAYTISTNSGGAFAVAGPAAFGSNAVTTIDTSASLAAGSVTFASTVDSFGPGPSNLIINSVATTTAVIGGAGVQFQGLVGSTANIFGFGATGVLGSLTVNGAGATVSAIGVQTTGNQAFNNTGSTTLTGTYNTLAEPVGGFGTVASGSFSVAGPTLLSGNTTLNFAPTGPGDTSGTITFTGTVNSTSGNTFDLNTTSNVGAPGDTAATAGTRFLAAVGTTDALSSLITNGTGSVSAVNVRTTGNQNYNNSGNTFLNGTYATITNGTFRVAGPTLLQGSSIVTTAGGGTITFVGAVDDVVAGTTSLTTTSTGAGGTAATAGTQFQSAVGANAALSFLQTNGAAGTVSALNVTTTGGAGQAFQNTGSTFLNGTYSTSGGTFAVAGPTLLQGSSIVTAGAGTITFTGTVDDVVAGTTSLTTTSTGAGATAATAGTQFLSAVGGSSALSFLQTNGAGGTVSAVNVTTTGGAGQAFQNTGSTFLNGTYSTSGGTFAVAGPTLLQGSSIVTAGAGTITFTGTVDDVVAGTTSLTTTSTAAGGTAATAGTRFLSAVGGNSALSFLQTNGAAGTVSALNVTTSGAAGQAFQNSGTTFLNGTYNTASGGGNGTFAVSGPAVLAGATAVTSGSGNITFSGTVDDTAAGTNTLSTDSTGITTFTGVVGGTAGPVSLTTNNTAGGAGTLNLRANVTTTGAQTYNQNTVNIDDNTGATTTITLATTNNAVNFASAAGNVALTDDLTVSTGSGNITFGGTVRGASNGAGNLVTTTSGTTNFNGVVGGGGLALATLTTNGVGAGQPGTLNVRGDITTIGAQNYNQATINIDDNNVANNTLTFSTVNNGLLFNNAAGNILLTDHLTLSINGGGSAITIAPTVNDAVAGTHTLTANQGGTINFNNTIGATTPLLSVVADGNTVNNGPAALTGILNIRANIFTRGNQTFNVATANINDTLGPVNTITFDSNNGGGNGTVNFQNAAGNTLLTDNLAITAGLGQILFAGTVNGATAGTQSLTTTSTNAGATAATAGTQFNGAIGGTTALSFLQTNGALGTVSAVNVTTTGVAGQAFQNTGSTFLNGTYSTSDGPFTVTGPTRLQGSSIVTAGAGTITFMGTVDDVVAGTTSLTTTSTGAGGTNFATDVGATARLLSLTTNGVGASTNFTETASGGQVVNAGTLTFNNGVTVAHGTLTTFDTSVGNATFASTLDSSTDGGLRNVTVNVGAGLSAVFAGDVGRTNATTGVGAVTPRRLGQLITTGGAGATTAFTSAAPGGQRIDATGMSFGPNVTIANATLTAFEANGAGALGNVTFMGTLNSAVAATFRSARVTTGTGAALATFTGAVGDTNPLGQLVVGGNSRFDGNVTLNGDARRISTDTTLVLLSGVPAATDAIQPIASVGAGAALIQPRISFTSTGTLAVGGAVTIAGNNGSLLFGNNINRVAGGGARSLALTTTAPVLTGTQYDALTDAQRRAFIQSYIPAVAFGGNVGSTVAGNRLDSFSINALGLRGMATVANDQSLLNSVVFSSAYQTNNFSPLTVGTLGGLNTVGNSPTFQVATTGNITFGQNEKVVAFGNLQLLSNAGAITLGDTAAIGAAAGGGGATAGNLTVGEAGTTAINILTRAAGRVATVGAASVSTANDAGVDFVGNSLAFSALPTLIGAGPNPQYATPTGATGVTFNGMNPAIGSVRIFPVALYSATPPSLLTDGTGAGTANNILALDIRSDGPVPRSDRNAFVNQVDIRGLRPILDDLTIKTADRDQLKKIELLVRDLPAAEIVDALIGRAVYNDRPGISDYFGATPYEQRKSAPRLSYDAVAKLVSAFNVLEPDRDAVSVAVTDAFEAVRSQTPGGLFTPDAFAAYAATQGLDTAQGSALARVRELLDLVDLIALSPVESRIVKRAIVKRFGPSGASREELDAMIAGLQKREQLAAR